MLHKIREEADEIEAALDRGDTRELAAETGDLLFALVNLARHVGADPETGAARHQRQIRAPFCVSSSARWPRRAVRWKSATLAEMDALWNEAKAEELHPPSVTTGAAERDISPVNPADIHGVRGPWR